MEGLIFIDSNIWCNYFDRSAQEHDIVSGKFASSDGRLGIDTS